MSGCHAPQINFFILEMSAVGRGKTMITRVEHLNIIDFKDSNSMKASTLAQQK